jgi:hypothetical protein
MERVAYTELLRYDLRTLLVRDLLLPHVASKAADAVCALLETVPQSDVVTYYRPDSQLLPPELYARDLLQFEVTMGNGWAVSLGYSSGIILFYRALRALRAIQHRRGLAMAESVADFLRQHGIAELHTFPDDYCFGVCAEWDLAELNRYDWELEQKLSAFTGPKGVDLDSDWWDVGRSYFGRRTRVDEQDPPLEYSICRYLLQHLDEIEATRNPPIHPNPAASLRSGTLQPDRPQERPRP